MEDFSKDIEQLTGALSLFSGKLESMIESVKDKVSPEEYEKLKKEHEKGIKGELGKIKNIDLTELSNLQNKM